MKTPVTVRVDSELLAEARRCAREENRTLTNFIETLLRHRIRNAGQQTLLPSAQAGQTKDKSPHAA